MGTAPGQMNLLWRDSVESLLDSSMTDAGDTPSSGEGGVGSGSMSWAATGDAANGAGSLLWQATLFGFEEVSDAAKSSSLDSTLNQILDVVWTATGGSGQPPVTLPHAPENPLANGFPESLGFLPPSELVWTNPPDPLGSFAGATGQPPVNLADSGNNGGASGVGSESLSLAATGDFANGAGSLLWQATLFGFEEVSAAANSSTLDATLNQILDVVWTATGGSGSPPVTLPHAPTNPFVDGFPLVSLPPSQLVWTGEPPLHGSFPDGTGQPPLTPPAADNRPASFDGGHVAPDNLLWTDSSQGVPATLNDQPNAGAAPFHTLFGRA